MSQEITGRDLLNAAIDWHKEHGAKPIPVTGTIGASKIDSSLFYGDENYFLKTLSQEEHAKSDNISNIPARIIPLLAGISIGLSANEISEIIKHHEITLDAVTRIDFSSRRVDAIPSDNSPTSYLTNAAICTAVAKAFSIDPDMYEQLKNEMSGHHSGPMILGAMHIDSDEVWPAGMIEDHARMVMSETKEFTFLRRFQGAVSEPRDISEFPKGSPAELINRSGMVTEAVLRKQTGYYDLWEDVVFEASYKSTPQMEVLNYIARVEDPDELKLLKRGLLSLSADASHHEFVAQSFHETLVKHFGDNPEFDDVINSIILKLNLVPTSDYQMGIDSMSEHMSLFDEVLNNQETLLSRVAQEILSRPENNLGLSELAVFSKLKLAKLPPQKITFSPEELINKLLDSWDNYVTSDRSRDRDKSRVDSHVSELIQDLIKQLSRNHVFDYEQFKHRSDNGKVLLIDSGLDVRKFKGLSRRALGRVLENDMGM